MPHAPRRSVIALLACVPLVGCTTWHHQAVKPIEYADSVVHYPGDGGVVISSGKMSEKTICVAPPAQGALLRETNTSTRARVDVVEIVGVETGFDHSTIEALARMYEQTERSLFLQYSLYRLCEAYMNNMLTPAAAKDILLMEAARYDQQATAAASDLAACEAHRATLSSVAELSEDKQEKAKIAKSLAQLDCGRYQLAQDSAAAASTTIKQRAQAVPDSAMLHQSYLYWLAFQRILDTSVELARLDADAAKVRAEAATAIAQKEKSDAEAKVKKLEETKTELESLRKQALDNELERAKCATGCGDKKDKPKDDKPKND